MKKFLFVIALVSLMAFSSCKKTRYCRCSVIIEDEAVELGEDYYLILDRSTCADRAKEIVGWGRVTCTEVPESEVTGETHNWWEFWKP
ncbi:MAG: hypothetical protein HUK16_03830 [Bacteroidales bacterium]|nr:hypothetical protein [Bacteroidales bacterium]